MRLLYTTVNMTMTNLESDPLITLVETAVLHQA
jgi:hypothetical protein